MTKYETCWLKTKMVAAPVPTIIYLCEKIATGEFVCKG
jgi:hypothetical protein